MNDSRTFSPPRHRSLASAFVLIVLLGQLGFAQEQPVPQTRPSDGTSSSQRSGGSATLGEFAPVLDSEKRPITAGGFVKEGPIVFKDVSKEAGLTGWHHVMGTLQKNYIIEVNGSGAALLDYDKDGWLDIYLVNGSTYEAMDGKAEPPHAALFHNNHDGTFTDVAEQAGVTNGRWGTGVAVGDYDNDGWPDLFVSNFGKNRLYHNNHDGTFTDVAEKAGVTLGNWSNGATFGDYDGDGRLDLFVPGYVHYDLSHPPMSGADGLSPTFCRYRGTQTMCGPRGLPGEPDHLFHNNGDGTFTDVSEKAGVNDKSRYYGFSSTFVDVDNDGKVDLLVTDDSSPNYLYINKGDGTFDNASFYSGFALTQDARESANMGLAVGDYRNNGLVDIYTTSFSDDYKPLFMNEGDGNFSEIAPKMGMAEITYPFLGWATEFIDYDNDGWKDIMTLNGHLLTEVEHHNWGTTYNERPLLFHNMNHGTKFAVVPAVEGTGLADVIPARGAAFGDIFNDGKIDVVVNCIDHAPVLLRNVNVDTNHWVGLLLIGGAKSPKDAIGATVYLTSGGMRQRGDVMSGGSYMSSNDQRLHFGLGLAAKVDKVDIHWPDGQQETIALPSVDRYFAVEEGKGLVPSVYDAMTAQSDKSKSAVKHAAK
jgi:enediyne biosynthesis protein E4